MTKERNYSESLIRRVQLAELEIFKEIDRICDKCGIEYFIIGGTALGAVRHQGFIPWDDDIDIGMTRSHFNKFNAIAGQHLSNDFSLQNISTDKFSPFPYTKIRRKNTKFVEYCNRNSKMQNGVYVDIFPYDNIPDGALMSRVQYALVQLVFKIYSYRTIPDITVEPISLFLKFKQFLRRAIHYLLKPVPKWVIYKALVGFMSLYNSTETKSKACLLFANDYINNDGLYPLRRILFEDSLFSAPKDCDQYLRNHYGAYWELPPENKRCGHMPYIVEL